MTVQRLTVKQRPDGLSLALAPVGPFFLWRQGVVSLVVGGAAIGLALTDHFAAAGIVGLCGLVLLTAWLVNAAAHAIVTVTTDHLQLATFLYGVQPLRKLEWSREQIVALNSRRGLCIITAANERQFFLERDPVELDYVASVLRQALQITEDVAPGRGELSVLFSGPLWPRPTPGIIGVRSGELTLRTSLTRAPLFIFSAHSAPRPRRVYGNPRNVIRLQPNEIVCRLPEAGLPMLLIAPTTPWPLRRGYTIPAGIVGRKMRLIPFWRRIAFEIWCEDGKALQAALASFWGADADQHA